MSVVTRVQTDVAAAARLDAWRRCANCTSVCALLTRMAASDGKYGYSVQRAIWVQGGKQYGPFFKKIDWTHGENNAYRKVARRPAHPPSPPPPPRPPLHAVCTPPPRTLHTVYFIYDGFEI